MDLAPSAVRKIILDEHAILKNKLAEIEKRISLKNYSDLTSLLKDFTQFFLKHIDHEDKILRPVLKDLDAWGDVRVDQMNEEHALQRDEIRRLNLMLSTHRPEEYLTSIQKFIGEIYLDIQKEEKECLNPDVLKDDPITSGMGG